jgi:hypothetical protein
MSLRRAAATEIEVYIRRKGSKLRRVAQSLRKLVKKSVPKVIETVNPWGLPTFEANGPFCYFMVGKNHVTPGFLKGISLRDPKALLEGTGKNLRHVKLRSEADLDQDALRELLKAAGRFNLKSPAKTMSSRGRSRAQ